MSTKVDVLVAGYSNPSELELSSPQLVKIPSNLAFSSRITASGSCSLVRSSGINILFDTLGPWQAQQLKDILSISYKLHPDDIDYVVCSHSHADHIGNLNLFTNAKLHLVGTCPYRVEEYFLDLFEPTGSYTYVVGQQQQGEEVGSKTIDVITYEDFKIENNPNLQVIPTYGHTLECISLIADNVDKLGRVALVGDLFEKEEDLKDDGIWIAAGSKDMDLQRANRSKILDTASYIVPGHGPIFKVPSKE